MVSFHFSQQVLEFYRLLLKNTCFIYFTAYRNCQADDIHCGLPSSTSSKTGYPADPCVPKEKKCDGYLDCRTGRDEDGCPGAKCRLDQFRCANGQKCIDNALKCNHKADCDDNSDEQGCSKLPYFYLSTEYIKNRLFSFILFTLRGRNLFTPERINPHVNANQITHVNAN